MALQSSKKLPTLFLELIDQRKSGFILEGTENTAHEVNLTAPRTRFIPVTGFRLAKGKNPETGEVEEFHEEIRYIPNQRILSLAEQEKLKIKPGRNVTIEVLNGNFSVVPEPGTMPLYNYLNDVFYNGSNPDRPESAEAIYRIKETDKEDMQRFEYKQAVAEATKFLGSLVIKQGDQYTFDEAKINMLCNVFLVFAETTSGKLAGLTAHAEKDAINFMNKALKVSQTTMMELSHAIELNIVKFEGNNLVYVKKDKVIFSLGKGNMNHEKKMTMAANLLGAPENKSAYEEFKIELEAEKESAF